MKNIFSTSETVPEVDPVFSTQRQPGALPTAPGCNPHLPVTAPVRLNPVAERVAGHAGLQTDWQKTSIR
jgi:hypothetical protein